MTAGTAQPDDPDAVEAFVAEIGRRVAERRRARGWTQAQLAEAAGIPVSAVGVIERGDRAAYVSRLWALADALGIRMADLVPDGGPVRADPRPEAGGRRAPEPGGQADSRVGC